MPHGRCFPRVKRQEPSWDSQGYVTTVQCFKVKMESLAVNMESVGHTWTNSRGGEISVGWGKQSFGIWPQDKTSQVWFCTELTMYLQPEQQTCSMLHGKSALPRSALLSTFFLVTSTLLCTLNYYDLLTAQHTAPPASILQVIDTTLS